jgi:hypothetical protein
MTWVTVYSAICLIFSSILEKKLLDDHLGTYIEGLHVVYVRLIRDIYEPIEIL